MLEEEKGQYEIRKESMPHHVAIIMDGNGRWAKAQNKERGDGHKEGMKTVRRVLEVAAELNIKYITLYAFSTENWNRPSHEVDGLMKLMLFSMTNELSTLIENGIKLTIIGNVQHLPQEVQEGLMNCVKSTENNTGPTLVLALSYSGRWDILNAVKNIAKEISEGALKVDEINEEKFNNCLSTKNIPDPDLLIRTSGELRMSNFLLWQLAYTELYFTSELWPNFSKENFYEAIYQYQQRERRLGKTSEQIAGGTNN